MHVPDRRLIIFAKWPEPGAVKTRLAATIGAEVAADLAKAFLLDLRVAAEALPIELVLAYSPADSRDHFAHLLGSRWRFWEQRGADLGERLAAALDRSDDRDTVIIGSDSPWLTPAELTAAFEALNAADAVVGPCADGGFYLLGVRAGALGGAHSGRSSLFSSVRWSTSNTFGDLRAGLARSGALHCLLPDGYDVDTEGDLWRLDRQLRHSRLDTLPATRGALARLPPGAAGRGTACVCSSRAGPSARSQWAGLSQALITSRAWNSPST